MLNVVRLGVTLSWFPVKKNFNGTIPLNSIPSTLVIGTQGRTAARIIGPVSRSSLTELITDIAAGH